MTGRQGIASGQVILPDRMHKCRWQQWRVISSIRGEPSQEAGFFHGRSPCAVARLPSQSSRAVSALCCHRAHQPDLDGIWFFSAHRAEAIAENFIQREAERGREGACPNRRIGGFPSVFVISCAEPRLLVVDAQGHAAGRPAWRAGPACPILSRGISLPCLAPPSWRGDGNTGAVELNWSSARASLRAGAESITEASVEIVEPNFAAGVPNNLDIRALAKSVNIHVRRSPATWRARISWRR